jgi:hypothetical protein
LRQERGAQRSSCATSCTRGSALPICREAVSPVYERAGWHTIPGPMSFSQPAGPTTYPGLTMVLDLGGTAWLDGEVELGGEPW